MAKKQMLGLQDLPKLSLPCAVGIGHRCIQRVRPLSPNGDSERAKVYDAVCNITSDYATGREVSHEKANEVQCQAKRNYDLIYDENHFDSLEYCRGRVSNAAQYEEIWRRRASAEAAARSFHYIAKSVVAATQKGEAAQNRLSVYTNVSSCFDQAQQSFKYFGEQDCNYFRTATLRDMRDQVAAATAAHDYQVLVWNPEDLRRDPWRGLPPGILRQSGKAHDSAGLVKGYQQVLVRDLARHMKFRRYAQWFPNVLLAGVATFYLSHNFWPGHEISSSFAVSGAYLATLVLATMIEREPDSNTAW